MVGINTYARPVWVVFTKRGPVPKLWHLFTTKEYGHCHVIIETISGVMKIDYSICGMSFYEVPCTWQEYLEANHEEITDCVRWNVKTNSTVKHLRGLLTCVTVVKAILIRCPWWVFTPKQLYEWMIKHG